MIAAPAATTPWSRPVRVTTGLLGAAGAVLLAVAWVASENSTEFGAQMAMTVLALAGLAAVVLAVVVWVLGGQRGIQFRLATAPFMPVRAERRLAPGPGETSDSDPAQPGPVLPVATAAMGHYHRPTCLMVTSKTVRAASIAAHQQAGRRPCEVCRPDA